jgi:hypothetical protein
MPAVGTASPISSTSYYVGHRLRGTGLHELVTKQGTDCASIDAGQCGDGREGFTSATHSLYRGTAVREVASAPRLRLRSYVLA